MRAFVARLRPVLSWLVRLQTVASVVALVVICGLTLLAITAREAGTSVLWTEEVSLLMMKVVVFQGAAGIYARRAYIVVGGLVSLFSPRLQWLVSLLAWAFIGGFAALVAYQGLQTYPTQIAIRSYLLELPKFYFTVPLIVGAATICLTSVYYLLATLAAGAPERGTEVDAHVPGLVGLGEAS